ncbi:lysozyme inhibitor LprI family protein [Uliginosibacterium paludis]|uniref:lysozyme inhibitor LprI family protein n=1 Tax=Uliginosibacterium paludis TaxID=1615952 RepID=UPI0031F6289C
MQISTACNLQCQNSRLSYQLEQSDKRLNTTYRQLVSVLSPSEKIELRKIQRNWIVQRDIICDGEEARWCEDSGCTNGFQVVSAGNERLSCLTDITEKRIVELKQAIKTKKVGVDPVLTFIPFGK